MMRHLLPSCTVLLLTSTPGVGQTVEQYIAQGDSLLATNKHARALDAYSKAVALSPSATTYAARARAFRWSALSVVRTRIGTLWLISPPRIEEITP